MRALKAALTACGELKRKVKNQDEDILALMALMDVNIPKFTTNDIPLFNSITSDLFPGVKMPDRDYGKLMDSLKDVCIENYWIGEDGFLNKCI